jgi:hypothetical protein
MILTAATNMTELKAAAQAYSEDNPSEIVFAFTIFTEGYIETAKRVDHYLVGDSHIGGYFRGGKFKPFSVKLRATAERKAWEAADR